MHEDIYSYPTYMHEHDKTCKSINKYKKKTKCKNLNTSNHINYIKHTKPSPIL
jgi:hypothetical protein